MKGGLCAFILLAGSLLVLGCSSEIASPGHYQDTPLVVDGIMNDGVAPCVSYRDPFRMNGIWINFLH